MRRRGARPNSGPPAAWQVAIAQALALLDERRADPADRDGEPCEECADPECPFATGDECEAAGFLEPLRPQVGT